MWTIRDYQEDSSSMGRINAWHFAANLAADRPVVGGGFQVFTPELFQKYAPNPTDFHDAHSIYFESLAEQGYVGLALFVLIGVTRIPSGDQGHQAGRCRGSRRATILHGRASSARCCR